MERFWKRVEKTPTCWLWRGASKTPQGYGVVTVDKKDQYAHRISWKAANGEMPPPGMCVCHTCDNPKCVNPDHLFLGTQKENVADMVSKGRRPAPKLACRRGHEYTPQNTHIYRYHGKDARRCKACVKINNDKFNAKYRAK